jgi:hypothetical protein
MKEWNGGIMDGSKEKRRLALGAGMERPFQYLTAPLIPPFQIVSSYLRLLPPTGVGVRCCMFGPRLIMS